MRFFHRTSPQAASRIVGEGFAHQTATYGLFLMTGTWLYDVLLDAADDGVNTEALLVIEMDVAEVDLAPLETIKEPWETTRTYREWFVPAGLFKSVARRATKEEEDVGKRSQESPISAAGL